MEKKVYERPTMQLEEFVPNQYVADCGDTEKSYLFTCTAPGGELYYYPDYPANGPAPTPGPGVTDSDLGGYRPCGGQHEASTTAEFFYGFVDKPSTSWPYTGNGHQDDDEPTLIVYLEHGTRRYWVWDIWPIRGHWVERDSITNWHATGELNMSQWTIIKS